MIAQLRLDVFIADFNRCCALVSRWSSGPEGARFAGVLERTLALSFRHHLAAIAHHIINGLKPPPMVSASPGCLSSFSPMTSIRSEPATVMPVRQQL